MPSLDRPTPTFPPEPWCIRERGFGTVEHALGATLFALGNGYIGLRGGHEEGDAEGSYLNGFYESEAIVYPEAAYGLAKTNQFMLNVPNAKGIVLWLGDERCELDAGIVDDYERVLDLRTGVLERTLEWTSPGGRRVAIRSRRLVCFEHKHLFAIEYTVTPLNFDGPLRLLSTIDGDVQNQQAGDDPRVGSNVSGAALHTVAQHQDGTFSALVQRTHNSGFTLVSAIDSSAAAPAVAFSDPACVGQLFEVAAWQGDEVQLVKYGCYYSSRDYPEGELLARARSTLQQARADGFDTLCAQQARYLARFWQQADVEISGDDALQQGMRFNLFHLLQSVGRDGKTNIAAKGVTGEGYEGHYFWDTEIYIFPFLLYSKPEIARKLLDYRYAGLEQARSRARQMAHAKGALYPWRTIAGEECSSYFPAGSAQYHINADIAYSIKSYFEATGDIDYMREAGAEIVFETARIWLGIGSYARDGAFCINVVTGPDEYTALVNNNYYTNAMARMHLRFAASLAETLPAQDMARIAAAIGLDDAELSQWRDAAAHILLPYDAALGIHAQDDSFLSKKVWNFEGTPAEHYPLLLNYHPMVIYRHQVCKQADVVLALLLLSDQFNAADKKRDFDYYEAITTHDSSLSSCIFSIIAEEVGYHDKAYDYFMETARLDLDNTHGNTQHGVHTAAMAGTWMGVTYGFAGMRVIDGALHFAPRLPAQWQHYQFKIQIRGALLQVRVDALGTHYQLQDGAGVTLSQRGIPVALTPEAPHVSLAWKDQA